MNIKLYIKNLTLNQYTILYCIIFDFALYLTFFAFLFLIINWDNFFLTLLCIELMYFGIITLFLFASLLLKDIKGQIIALILLILAASESAIGLGILIVLFKFGKSIYYKDYNKLK